MESTEKYSDLIGFMRSKGAFRSSEVVACASEIGISKRTCDTVIKRIHDEGLLIQIKQGLYLTSECLEREHDQALARAAMILDPQGTISLGSALTTNLSGAQSQRVDMVSVPGKIGTLTTDAGRINIFSVSRKLQNSLSFELGLDRIYTTPTSNLRTHTPEMAAFCAAYLHGVCGGRSGFDVESIGGADVQVDWMTVREMCSITGLSDRFIEPIRKTISNEVSMELSNDSPSPF